MIRNVRIKPELSGGHWINEAVYCLDNMPGIRPQILRERDIDTTRVFAAIVMD